MASRSPAVTPVGSDFAAGLVAGALAAGTGVALDVARVGAGVARVGAAGVGDGRVALGAAAGVGALGAGVEAAFRAGLAGRGAVVRAGAGFLATGIVSVAGLLVTGLPGAAAAAGALRVVVFLVTILLSSAMGDRSPLDWDAGPASGECAGASPVGRWIICVVSPAMI